MEAVVEDQGRPGPDGEIEFEGDAINFNQDEEFDFDIGGAEDTLGTIEGDAATNDALAHQKDSTETFDDTYTHEAQDEVGQEPAVESYDEENYEQGDDQYDLDTAGFDNPAETEDVGQTWQINDQDGHETAEYGDSEEHQEGEKHDEIYYEETAAEFESFEGTTQVGPDHNYDSTNTTTSVEYLHHGREPSKAQQGEADEIQAGGETEPLLASNNPEEAFEEGETAPVEADDEVLDQNASVEHDNGVDSNGGDFVDTSLTEDDVSADWEAEGHDDHRRSNAQPSVRVSYRTEEYYLFAESPDDDPDTYFLKDLESIHQPLYQFLSSLRQVVSEDLTPTEELCMKVDGLGLEFGESTTSDFLEQTTFGQILELHDRLVKHDDGVESPELYVYLDKRPNCLHRFTELSKAADEGKGLSHYALYYDDDSADILAEEDGGDQSELAQDDVSFIESYDDGDELADKMDDSNQVHQPSNPFSIIAETQRLNADSPSWAGIGESEDVLLEALPVGTAGADAVGEAPDGNAENQDDFELETTDTLDKNIAEETAQGIAAVPHQVDDVVTDNFGDDHGADGHEKNPLNDEGVAGVDEEAEVLVDYSLEEHERTDDHDAEAADNEDYLDLENDGDDPQQTADIPETTNSEALECAGHSSTPRQISHNSSATATLDGEENGHGDDTIVSQGPADSSHITQSPNQPDVDLPQDQDDEIDWNHDDDELDVANQNPTDLSPESLSAKRSRQADEGEDGLGDASAVKRRRI